MMLSVYARGDLGRALIDFAKQNGVNSDWSDTDITAMLSGNVLDNITDDEAVVCEDGRHVINREIMVHLTGNSSTIVVNLATILAMATDYCRLRQDASHRIMEMIKERAQKRALKHENGGNPSTSQG